MAFKNVFFLSFAAITAVGFIIGIKQVEIPQEIKDRHPYYKFPEYSDFILPSIVMVVFIFVFR